MTITEAELRLAADQLRRTAGGLVTAADRHQHVLTGLTRATDDLPELWTSPAATRVTAAGSRLTAALQPVPGHFRAAADELVELALVADGLGDEVAGHAAAARAALTAANDAISAWQRAGFRADDDSSRRAQQREAIETRRHDAAQHQLEVCAATWIEACRRTATALGRNAVPVRATVRHVGAPQASAELGPLDPGARPPPEPVDVIGTVERAIDHVGSVTTAEWLTRSSFAGLRATAAGALAARVGRADLRSSDPTRRGRLVQARHDRLAAAVSRRDTTITAGPRSLTRGLRAVAARSPLLAGWSAHAGDLAAHAPRLAGAARLAGGAAGHLGTGIAFRETVVAVRAGDTEGVVTHGASTAGGVMMGGGFVVAKTAGAGAMITTAGVAFPPVVIVGAGLVVGAYLYENREVIGRTTGEIRRAVGRTVGDAARTVGRTASAAVDGARSSLRDARSFARRTLGKAS